jgi:hypothetical protein
VDIIKTCEGIGRENVKTSGKDLPGYYDLKHSEEWDEVIMKEYGPDEWK